MTDFEISNSINNGTIHKLYTQEQAKSFCSMHNINTKNIKFNSYDNMFYVFGSFKKPNNKFHSLKCAERLEHEITKRNCYIIKNNAGLYYTDYVNAPYSENIQDAIIYYKFEFAKNALLYADEEIESPLIIKANVTDGIIELVNK